MRITKRFGPPDHNGRVPDAKVPERQAIGVQLLTTARQTLRVLEQLKEARSFWKDQEVLTEKRKRIVVARAAPEVSKPKEKLIPRRKPRATVSEKEVVRNNLSINPRDELVTRQLKCRKCKERYTTGVYPIRSTSKNPIQSFRIVRCSTHCYTNYLRVDHALRKLDNMGLGKDFPNVDGWRRVLPYVRQIMQHICRLRISYQDARKIVERKDALRLEKRQAEEALLKKKESDEAKRMVKKYKCAKCSYVGERMKSLRLHAASLGKKKRDPHYGYKP